MKTIKELKGKIELRVLMAFMGLMTLPYGMMAQVVRFEDDDLVESANNLAESASNIIFAATGVGALVGGFIVAKKYWQSEQDAPKALTKWLTGLAIIALLGVIIRVFTGNALQ